MKIKKATIKDIDILIKIRLDFLKEEFPAMAIEEENRISCQLKNYFPKYLYSGDFVAYIGLVDDNVASTVFMTVQEMPANPSNMTGKSGTVLNVYTYPKYRKNGYASKIMIEIIEEAKRKGLFSLNLNATEMGKSLYEKLGFKDIPYSGMWLKL